MTQQQDYVLSIAEAGDYVMIVVNAPVTRELVREFNHAAQELAREHALDAYLFDMRGVVNVASTTDNYKIAYEDAPANWFNRRSKIAVLHRPDDTSHQFVETVAVNAGYLMKHFTVEQEAMAWLKE